jgi:hypothetical protein
MAIRSAIAICTSIALLIEFLRFKVMCFLARPLLSLGAK